MTTQRITHDQVPTWPDASEADAHAYPYVIVDPEGRSVDRYGSEDVATTYLGECPQGFGIVYDPHPREMSRRTDLP